MTSVWDKAMSMESARELLDLLNSRVSNPDIDIDSLIRCFVGVVEGKYEDVANVERIRDAIELDFQRAISLIAPPETTLKDEFWQTNAGQLLAAVQYWLYGNDAITVSNAAQAIYGKSDNGAIASTLRLIERGRLKAIHKPEAAFLAKRKTTKVGFGTNRSRLVIKSSLDAYLAERQ